MKGFLWNGRSPLRLFLPRRLGRSRAFLSSLNQLGKEIYSLQEQVANFGCLLTKKKKTFRLGGLDFQQLHLKSPDLFVYSSLAFCLVGHLKKILFQKNESANGIEHYYSYLNKGTLIFAKNKKSHYCLNWPQTCIIDRAFQFPVIFFQPSFYRLVVHDKKWTRLNHFVGTVRLQGKERRINGRDMTGQLNSHTKKMSFVHIFLPQCRVCLKETNLINIIFVTESGSGNELKDSSLALEALLHINECGRKHSPVGALICH